MKEVVVKRESRETKEEKISLGKILATLVVALSFCGVATAQDNADAAKKATKATSSQSEEEKNKADAASATATGESNASKFKKVALPQKRDPNATQLDTVVVKDVPINESILPIRPTSTAFGLEQTVKDTPRSVYQVSADQLKKDSITGVSDLARYAPSINNYVNQGGATAPYIRGQAAEVYSDGIRQGLNTHPFNNNAYESLDIVSGPASPIYGPSPKTAGYINWIPKRPSFEKNSTEINTKFGTYNSERGGYNDYTWQVDNTGPLIKDKLAYRVSYQQKEAESYYIGQHNNQVDTYFALSWLPNKDLSVDWNFEHANYDYSDLRGWNRITQDLIDNGNYLSGSARPIFRNGSTYYTPDGSGGFLVVNRTTSGGNRIYTTTGTAYVGPTTGNNNASTQTSIAAWVFDPASTSTQKINASAGVQSSLDNVLVKQYINQFKVKYTVDDEFTILNKTYVEHDDFDRQTLIDAALQGSRIDVFENRIEFQVKKDYEIFGINIKHDSTSGFSERITDVTSVSNVSNWQIFPFDLTKSNETFSLGQLYGVGGASIIPYVQYDSTNSRYYVTTGWGNNLQVNPYFTVNGLSNDVLSPANTAVHEFRTESGLFTLHKFDFDDQWSWLIGGRGTFITTTVDDPVVYDYNQPVSGNGAFKNADDNSIQVIPNISSSLSYKPVEWHTIYLTYNYLQAINPTEREGVSYSSGATGGNLVASSYHSASMLAEVGNKFDIIPNQLFATVAGFYQERNLAPIMPSATTGQNEILYPKVFTRGFEASLQYQPNRNFKTGVNYSFFEGNYSLQSTPQFAAVVVADGQTGVAGTEATGTATRQNARIALPRQRINYFASYQLDCGLGIKSDFWVTDSYKFNQNLLTIPVQHALNFGVFYERPNWSAGIDFLNVTDQTNFSMVQSDGQTDRILASEPFGIQGKFSVKF